MVKPPYLVPFLPHSHGINSVFYSDMKRALLFHYKEKNIAPPAPTAVGALHSAPLVEVQKHTRLPLEMLEISSVNDGDA